MTSTAAQRRETFETGLRLRTGASAPGQARSRLLLEKETRSFW
jgi:hypothetical protein